MVCVSMPLHFFGSVIRLSFCKNRMFETEQEERVKKWVCLITSSRSVENEPTSDTDLSYEK